MPGLQENTFQREDKRQALESVLQSQTFARADQLKKFLRYICDMEEAGRADEITEYSIGTQALGRPRSYSPTVDSGVRGRAHDLRQKLDQYYELENANARLRIGLRKGSYAPYFFESEPKDEKPPALTVQATAASTTQPTRHRVPAIIVGLTLLGAAIAILGMRSYYAKKDQLPPIFEEFWGSMIQRGADVVLCVATPPSLLIKPYSETPNKDIFRPLLPDNSAWYSRIRIPNRGGTPYMYFSGDSPLFGDAEAAVDATRILSLAGANIDFLPENTLQPAGLRNRDVLVIGSPNYSAYAARALKNAPFTIIEDSELGEEVIREQISGPSKGLVFLPKRDESRSLILVYGLITVFPNQTFSGRSSRTIVVSGVTGAGTAAAMHFFSSESSLAYLRNRIHKEGILHPPEAYQIVVKGVRAGAVPLSWELAAYRAIRPPAQ